MFATTLYYAPLARRWLDSLSAAKKLDPAYSVNQVPTTDPDLGYWLLLRGIAHTPPPRTLFTKAAFAAWLTTAGVTPLATAPLGDSFPAPTAPAPPPAPPAPAEPAPPAPVDWQALLLAADDATARDILCLALTRCFGDRMADGWGAFADNLIANPAALFNGGDMVAIGLGIDPTP